MSRNLAVILVGLAGVCWASSGVAVQDFFSHSAKSPMELTNIRMCSAGFLMLVILFLRGKFLKSFVRLKMKPNLLIHLALYGIIGVVIVQFTYFQAISIGGAAPTTVILSSTPVMAIAWDAIHAKKLPRRAEILAVIFAMLGVFLLVTGGNPTKILVPLTCVLWSLSSGAAFVFSMFFGKHLFAEKIDPMFMTSTGMFFGGLLTFPLIENKNWTPFFKSEVIFDVAWIVIFGTATAFLIFNAGLKFITAEEAAITSTTEPASSVVISYFVFGTAFGLIESVGIILVLLAIISPVILKNF